MKQTKILVAMGLLLGALFTVAACGNEGAAVNLEGILREGQDVALVAFDCGTKEVTKQSVEDGALKNVVAAALSPAHDKMLLGKNGLYSNGYAYSVLDLAHGTATDYEAAVNSYQSQESTTVFFGVFGYDCSGFWLNHDMVANMAINAMDDIAQGKTYTVALPEGAWFAGYAEAAGQDKAVVFHVPDDGTPYQKAVSTLSYSLYDRQGRLLATRDTGVKQNLDIATGELRKDVLAVYSSLDDSAAGHPERVASTLSLIHLPDNTVASVNQGFAAFALDPQATYCAGVCLRDILVAPAYEDSDGHWLVVYDAMGNKVKGWEAPQDFDKNMAFASVFWSGDSKAIYVLGVNHETGQSTVWQASMEEASPVREVLSAPYTCRYAGMDGNLLYLLVENK